MIAERSRRAKIVRGFDTLLIAARDAKAIQPRSVILDGDAVSRGIRIPVAPATLVALTLP